MSDGCKAQLTKSGPSRWEVSRGGRTQTLINCGQLHLVLSFLP
jgi:hypothetical protein